MAAPTVILGFLVKALVGAIIETNLSQRPQHIYILPIGLFLFARVVCRINGSTPPRDGTD